MSFFPRWYLPFQAAPPSLTDAPLRDFQILELIQGRLNDTKAFDLVTVTGPPEDQGQSSESIKLAGLELAAFTDEVQTNDYDAIPEQRSITFVLWICVRNADALARDREVDRLRAVAANAINGQSIGGATYATMTLIRGGQWLPAAAPERKLRCLGQFVYDIPDLAAHNTLP